MAADVLTNTPTPLGTGNVHYVDSHAETEHHPITSGSGVALLVTGGTISSVDKDGTGPKAALGGGELLSGLAPAERRLVSAVSQLDPLLNSWNIDLAAMISIAAEAETALSDPRNRGLVVTHGTDTLEETAFFLDLVLDTDKPVIITGAMGAADSESADGVRNLSAAIRGAGDQSLSGHGVLVCFDGRFHRARNIQKSHTNHPRAFDGSYPPVAQIDEEGRLVVKSPVVLRHKIKLRGGLSRLNLRAEDVPLISVYSGMSPRILRGLIQDSGARAIVIEGFGAGNLPGDIATEVRELIGRGRQVVVSSRVAEGVVLPTYGGDGGGRSLAEFGVAFAGPLSSAKARLLLLLCLHDNSSSAALSNFKRFVMDL